MFLAGRSPAELMTMEVEVLDRISVDLRHGHAVTEEGIPPDGVVHAEVQGLIVRTLEPKGRPATRMEIAA
jgi:hypothetical protein